jgi:hypothetical protein
MIQDFAAFIAATLVQRHHLPAEKRRGWLAFAKRCAAMIQTLSKWGMVMVIMENSFAGVLSNWDKLYVAMCTWRNRNWLSGFPGPSHRHGERIGQCPRFAQLHSQWSRSESCHVYLGFHETPSAVWSFNESIVASGFRAECSFKATTWSNCWRLLHRFDN